MDHQNKVLLRCAVLKQDVKKCEAQTAFKIDFVVVFVVTYLIITSMNWVLKQCRKHIKMYDTTSDCNPFLVRSFFFDFSFCSIYMS